MDADEWYGKASPAYVEGAAIDVALAQHFLQKLNLVSAENFESTQEFITFRLRRAEDALMKVHQQPSADHCLEQIAGLRRVLAAMQPACQRP